VEAEIRIARHIRALSSALAAVAVAATLFAQPARAEEGPVVVELFTSQGCSSCPPADEILGELTGRDNVIALALHVDYWDYLGWRDSFALPGHTKRQKAYRAALGARAIYTPQILIDGEADVVGSREGEVLNAIRAARAKPKPAKVGFDDMNGRMIARVAPVEEGAAPRKPATVWMVTYAEPQTVAIARGENAGRTITYFNAVTSWTRMGEWRGEATNYDAPMPEGAAGAVVLVQEGKAGPILGAAEYRR
jgi:hypothetical protein